MPAPLGVAPAPPATVEPTTPATLAPTTPVSVAPTTPATLAPTTPGEATAPSEASAPTATPPDEDDDVRYALGLLVGASMQADQLVTGLSFAARGLGVGFVELEARLSVGFGGRVAAVRAALNLSLAFERADFRARLLLGGAVVGYQAIGAFAEWCNKAEVECGETYGGLEIGLGVGWSFLSVDAIVGSGQLPRFSLLVGATWVFG